MSNGVRAGTCALAALAALASGCSLVLDWDVKPDGSLDPVACTYKEPNDTLAQAPLITPLDTGPGGICTNGERDYYRFSVPADMQTVTVQIAFDAAMDLDLNLYDAGGGPLATGSAFGIPMETIVCPGATPTCPQLSLGDYVFEVFSVSPTVKNLYTISLTIQ
jgi:hypothetical protein